MFGTRKTGSYAVIFDESFDPGRPEHRLLARDPSATNAMADPGIRTSTLAVLSVLFRILCYQLSCTCR